VTPAAALLLVAPALAAGRSLTVLVCEAADGCPVARDVLAAEAARGGLAWTDLPTLLDDGAAAADAALRAAEAALAASPGPESVRAWAAARAACPRPIPPAREAVAWAWAVEADLRAGDRAGAARRAAALAVRLDGQLVDLPPVSAEALAALLGAAADLPAPVAVRVAVPAPVDVSVDGGPFVRRAAAGQDALWLRPGPHRLVLQRPGAASAVAREVGVPGDGGAPLRLEAPPAGTTLDTAFAAAFARPDLSPPDPAPLRAAAASRGVDALRLVRVGPAGDAAPAGGGAVLRGPEGAAHPAQELWLDLRSGQYTGALPPAGLRPLPAADRLRVGLRAGYGAFAGRDHATLAVEAAVPVGGPAWLRGAVSAGVWRGNRDYYLYSDWVSPLLFPVEAGLRVGPTGAGPRAGLGVLAVVPTAVGARATAGWEFGVGRHLRAPVEAWAAWTDAGPAWGLAVGLDGRR